MLINAEQLSREGVEDLAAGLSRHAPRLKSFTISFADKSASNELPNSFWSALLSSEDLTLDHDYSIPSVLRLLTSALCRLQIRPPVLQPPITFSPLLEALSGSPSCTESLRSSCLPPTEAIRWGFPDAPTLSRLQAKRVQIVELCTKRNIKVVTVARSDCGN